MAFTLPPSHHIQSYQLQLTALQAKSILLTSTGTALCCLLLGSIMDSYYTSPSSSYYYPNSCPLHDSPASFVSEPYHDNYYPYAAQSTPTHPSVSYYYPSFTDSSPPPMPMYNTMTAQYPQTNYCTQPSAPLKLSQTLQQQQQTSTLNSTFELGK